jgi:hypothetical protein
MAIVEHDLEDKVHQSISIRRHARWTTQRHTSTTLLSRIKIELAKAKLVLASW